MEKLLKIQTELVTPKDNYNKFGDFSYRSAEDILAKVKPLLLKYNCMITLSDEIVEVGGWHYVKATAMFSDIDGGSSTFTTAFARETETRKGNDLAQITGACSSYARKYALQGLLAVDSAEQDPDSNEQTRIRREAETVDGNKIGQREVTDIASLIEKTNTDISQVLEYYRVNTLEEMTVGMYADCVKRLSSK